MLGALLVEQSPLIPPGMIVWKRGSEVLGLVSAPELRFWRRLGFTASAPAGCTSIQISTADFERLREDIPEAMEAR